VWDYVRLELNDGSKTYPVAPASGRPDAPVQPAVATIVQLPVSTGAR
jgi:hypothetical protein